MKAVAIAVRRTILGMPSEVGVRAGEAFGYAVALLTGVGLELWLLFGLISFRPTSG